MMTNIRILDEHVANQIAAGEVVERPSSIVKELVENAIDAKSNKISIAIEDGGLTSIRVTDNGVGIAADECELAFERHATSKISVGRDLFQIRSLGFRGEALPSIAAVSKLECTTSARTDGLGRRIVIAGGELLSSEQVAAERGTDMMVRDLFFNTPARLKYMKSVQTELSHISNYIYRLCLAHPDIAFTFSHQHKVLLRTLGNGDLLQTIAAIYGASLARQMIPIEAENLDYELAGFIGKPEVTRANRFGISLIVNGRYVQNYSLAKAVMNAYHTLLPINRFPLAVLHIRMDPSLLDVNVHPSKLEVRFSKEPELLQFIEQSLQQHLAKKVLIPQGKTKKAAVIQEQLAWVPPADEVATAKEAVANEAAVGEVAAKKGVADELVQPAQEKVTQEAVIMPKDDRPFSPTPSPASARRAQGQYRSGRESQAEQVKEVMRALEPPTDMEGQTAKHGSGRFPVVYPIGQMRGTYIIAQNEEGLFLIDQHAAHERIYYEYYYDKFGREATVSQQLLVPLTLEFTAVEANMIKEQLSLFEQVGVYMDEFGGNSFIVRSHPSWFPKGAEKHVIEEMVEWVITNGKAVDVAKFREQSAIMCACQSAIKAHQPLSNAEIEALLAQLRQCRHPFTCPHGRPIVVSYSNYELEKMFKRV